MLVEPVKTKYWKALQCLIYTQNHILAFKFAVNWNSELFYYVIIMVAI